MWIFSFYSKIDQDILEDILKFYSLHEFNCILKRLISINLKKIRNLKKIELKIYFLQFILSKSIIDALLVNDLNEKSLKKLRYFLNFDDIRYF